jgi:acyl-CoA thioesterase I
VKRLIVLVILWCTATAAQAARPVILVFGDSISAGYGLSRVELGWVALLQARLNDQGYGYQIVNASVTGETSGGGLARLPRALALHHPALVIVELGGNDGLRALPTAEMQNNLSRMIGLATAAGAKVLLLGMRIPPNYGPEYSGQFQRVYSTLAHDDKVPFVPFLLEGVALSPASMQADGIHPNETAQMRLLENVWPALKPMLEH